MNLLHRVLDDGLFYVVWWMFRINDIVKITLIVPKKFLPPSFLSPSLPLSLSLPLTDLNLNPVFSLLPLYTGHPTFQVLAETLRNQIFAMPHPPIHRMAQQQLTEREWYDYARRIWLTLKKANLYSEYDQIVRATPPD